MTFSDVLQVCDYRFQWKIRGLLKKACNVDGMSITWKTWRIEDLSRILIGIREIEAIVFLCVTNTVSRGSRNDW
ncbi:unnamed protein product [Caenorhabditis angaria]|uniref:Uncharacterized protein n=1 Tax=Caenorhabditis angaria TaxID=860376 RepID=A0A9P1IF94_9PELO|nr:unnamed protein product [Caenorhabditis angaria]